MNDESMEFRAAQDAAASQSGNAVRGGTARCHEGNWIHVRYEYTEGDPVTDATYVVQKPNNGRPGGEVLLEGVLSIGPNAAHDFVHVPLGDYSGEVEVFFIDDPTEPVAYIEEQPVEDEKGWFSRVVQGVLDGGEWIVEVAQGDFNEDMSTGQIVSNALVTAIPVVDQVADLRDLVANGKFLIWDKRYNEIGVWVGVLACLIGLVPSLGSLAKGVIKIIWRNAGEIGRALIYINKGLHLSGKKINGYRFIRKLADEVVAQVGFVNQKFGELLDQMAGYIGRWQARFGGGAELLQTIEELRGMSRVKLDEAAQEIADRIRKGLDEFLGPAFRARVGQSIIVRRATAALRRMTGHASWQSTMTRPIDIEVLEAGARPLNRADGANLLRLNQLAERWCDDLIADPRTPASLKSLPRSVLLDSMKTFGARPALRTFAAGEKMTVYRVVGSEGQIPGGFWSRSIPPETEDAWRSRDAVLNEWNDGGAFVKSTIPPPDAVLVGQIGPQDLGAPGRKAPKPGYMLEGGGEQIWVPRHADGPATRVSEYYHTPWNEPVFATRSIVRAGQAGECDL